MNPMILYPANIGMAYSGLDLTVRPDPVFSPTAGYARKSRRRLRAAFGGRIPKGYKRKAFPNRKSTRWVKKK